MSPRLQFLTSAVEVIGCTCKTNVSFTYGSCNLTTWRHLVRDNVCHDITNNEECLYDGGDCCRPIAYRGLPGCIECKCKTGRIEPINGLEPNKTYRTYDSRWGNSEFRPPDQRLTMVQPPERRLHWIYKYEDYPELADGNQDYDDVKIVGPPAVAHAAYAELKRLCAERLGLEEQPNVAVLSRK